jgi:hypothetical protein
MIVACRRKSSRQKCSYVAQHLKQHRVRELSRESILLARMVRRKKPRQICRQLITRAMTKRKRSQRRNQPALLQQSQIGPHRDAAKDHHSARPQNLQLALQVVPAIRQLRRQRFIRGWRATQGRGHVSILQSEPIVAIHRSGLIRKSRAKHSLVQKIAGAIAGEHSSRAIGPMRCGRKPQNQKLRARIAESWNRSSPIVPSEKRSALVPRDLFAIPYQPRASSAANNFLIQFFQVAHWSHRKVIMNPAKPAKRLSNMPREGCRTAWR